MAIELIEEDNRFRIRTQEFSTEWLPNTPVNRQMAVVWLRYLVNEKGRPLFTLQELATVVGSRNRQAASQHGEDFRACGEDFRGFLTRQRKVDADVVACVEKALDQEPLLEVAPLVGRVHKALGRTDITEVNVRVALEQISCAGVLTKLRRQLTTGKIQYQEAALLEELLSEVSERTRQRLAVAEPPETAGMPLSDPTTIQSLVTPDVPITQVPNALAWVTFLMTLYYWNVPLSVLGRWMGVHKTTILRWILGLALALWPMIYQWLLDKVKARQVYIDEKWLKIKGRWHYWFVVLDTSTELPILAALLPSRSRWACRWVGLKLQRLGKKPTEIVTDGLRAYHYLLNGAKHILCRFHQQQGVTTWLKKHFTEKEQIEERKPEMKALLQTTDKRTVRRRLQRLKEKAEAWGITGWVDTVVEKLPALICSIGSSRLPSTTNAIERFFRAFNRFYKTRGGFHSVLSAKRELILFLVVYLFTQRDTDGKAPIEAIVPDAPRMPLYRLINDPFGTLAALKNVKPATPLADFLLSQGAEA